MVSSSCWQFTSKCDLVVGWMEPALCSLLHFDWLCGYFDWGGHILIWSGMSLDPCLQRRVKNPCWGAESCFAMCGGGCAPLIHCSTCCKHAHRAEPTMGCGQRGCVFGWGPCLVSTEPWTSVCCVCLMLSSLPLF